MEFGGMSTYRSIICATALVAMASGCAGGLPPQGGNVNAAALASRAAFLVRPADTTSILKKDTKSVVIGSTVDAKNGDKDPRSLQIAPCKCSGLLQQGDLVTCNFEDKAGTAGDGTTIEVLTPTTKSKPFRFAQSNDIKGCDGAGLTSINEVYAAGLTSGKIVEYTNKAVIYHVFSGKPITDPFADTDGLPKQQFSPEYIYAGTTPGGIVSISVGFYGDQKATQVADGFAVQTGSKGDSAASGLQYDKGSDTLYILDAVTNTVVAFTHASQLNTTNEIVVQPGGKTFKCLYPKTTCGVLVKAGKPLDAPLASTLLPNGNLIVANTQGTANTLVELTPQGQILDTKVVDKSTTQGVFGLASSGTNDDNTVVYFTDSNSNNVQGLEP
jgi:hypothetical protein